MYGFLLFLLVLDGLLLAVVVLLQAGKGGGLASMGGATAGSDSLIGGRQAATLLTKASWTTGAIFLGLALVLSVLSSRQRQPESVLRGLQQQTQQQAPAAAPAPLLPGSEAPAGSETAPTPAEGAPAPTTTGQ